MPKLSAGLLVYRSMNGRLEVLLVHPGGPYWAKRDDGAWSLPKGEYAADEDPLRLRSASSVRSWESGRRAIASRYSWESHDSRAGSASAPGLSTGTSTSTTRGENCCRGRSASSTGCPSCCGTRRSSCRRWVRRPSRCVRARSRNQSLGHVMLDPARVSHAACGARRSTPRARARSGLPSSLGPIPAGARPAGEVHPTGQCDWERLAATHPVMQVEAAQSVPPRPRRTA